MLVLRMILRSVAAILMALLLAIMVSMPADSSSETIAAVYGISFTVTGIGGALSFLTIVLFAFIRSADLHGRDKKTNGFGELLNAAAFGVLPGISVWKVFELATTFSRGKEVFEPLPDTPFLTDNGFFAPSAIELICSILCFTAVLIWLIARKTELPGNGDLLMTVICIWGLLRTVSETVRAIHPVSADNVNVVQILLLISADVCFVIWTVRKEKMQKSIALTVLEWCAVLSCQAIILLNSSDVLTTGSQIGDLAVNIGCAVLCVLLMLFSAKDSRAEKYITAGSDNPVFGS